MLAGAAAALLEELREAGDWPSPAAALSGESPDEGPDAWIVANASEELRTPRERLRALAALEREIELDGSGAAEAAFVRLAATLDADTVKWSEAAAHCLQEHGREGARALIEALYIARWHGDHDAAELLLLPFLDRPWAKAARLRLATQRGQWESIKASVEDLMRVGPDQVLRVLLGPARDPGAPIASRVEAYQTLLHVLEEELGNREFAKTLHREWINASLGDRTPSAVS